MAKRAQGLPSPPKRLLKKSEILKSLGRVDASDDRRARVLKLEEGFRSRIATHLESLPSASAPLRKFNTSPFVLLMHSFHQKYSKLSQLESDIVPAKLFSSMETSAGRMVEAVALPIYGWECVASSMHTAESALDGRRVGSSELHLVTLKSGPRCLNDEMSENFADAIVGNAEGWARSAGKKSIDFTYGVLYGTQKLSNKKDWHILRNIREKIEPEELVHDPDSKWFCEFERAGVSTRVTVRIGVDWWAHLGGEDCLVEVCAALIRACVRPGDLDEPGYSYTISDLSSIIRDAPDTGQSFSLLQKSQIPWLFFIATHFCDELEDA